MPAFYVAPSRQEPWSSTVLWDGAMMSDAKVTLFFDAIATFFRAEDHLYLDLLKTVSKFIDKKELGGFIDQLVTVAHQLFPPRIVALLEAYVVATNIEGSRYSGSDAKLKAFWPNPVHPDHPRPLIGEKPYVRKHRILDKRTLIAAAGSCLRIRDLGHSAGERL